jgi:hypothetical protein
VSFTGALGTPNLIFIMSLSAISSFIHCMSFYLNFISGQDEFGCGN